MASQDAVALLKADHRKVEESAKGAVEKRKLAVHV